MTKEKLQLGLNLENQIETIKEKQNNWNNASFFTSGSISVNTIDAKTITLYIPEELLPALLDQIKNNIALRLMDLQTQFDQL